MARAKNRGYQQSFSPSYTIRRWRLGIYIRLSKEDLKKGKDDSNSVKNQRDLLNDFYRRNIDEFESITEYVDDGHTGTDANREDFQRLLADVMSGKINCVIVKDLSRFARNYSDAGSLIDNLFVQMGVRFISLAENVDSYKNPDSVSNIIVPITNVMNDNYCYQTSKKIRQVFDYKRRNGQYIGAFAPYGYVKHPKDKHRLIVDPDAAENVKLIFTMLIQGSSKRAIALYLNEHGIPSPSAYKVQKGLPVSTRGYDDPMWGVRMIHSILTNPTYTGDLAQGRSRVKSYKVHQIEAVPREEWVEVAGTHEAIIDYETFDKVQALLQRDTRTSPKGREVHLFSGFLKCADCGRAITRCVGKNNNVYYSCSTYKNRSRTACTMHSIKHERLEAAVLFAVQHQVHLAVSYSEIVTQINSAPIKKSQSYRLDDLIAAKERELTKITRYKQSLYQDWKDGEITQQEYRDMKADYERQTSDISAVLTRLNAERAELANGVDNEHPALVAFMKYQNIEALNREILVELQEALSVDNGKGFIIFLDPEKNYNVYRPDEKGILQTPSGSLSGKEFSKYTEQSDETHRLDYIPYAETETPSEAPQKQSSKAKSMEKTVSQSSPDVSTQEAAFPVTINRSLVDDIMDDKTFISRIPGSKLHIKLPLFSIADDGKTLVSAIDPQKEYEIFKNDSPTSNPLLNMKGAQILPYYDPVRRKNITKQFGQNQNKILKFSQNPASKHKPKSSPIRKKDLKL